MLDKAPLLARPRPHLGESLLSYLIRLSQENDMPLLFLLNYVRSGKRDIQKDDFRLLDVIPTSLIDITRLSEATGCSSDTLLGLTMTNVLGIFSHSENMGRSRFMSGMIRDFLSFCPCCLAEEPTLHLIWRIEGINLCVKHGTRIQHECSLCGTRIKYKHIKEIGTCPHCERPLTDGKPNIGAINDLERKQQEWLINIWCELMNSSLQEVKPKEVAMKLLYLLNEFGSMYAPDIVSRNLNDASILPTLLQHARGSLTQIRTLHLKFILHCLYKYHMSFSDFAELLVPQQFFGSVHMERITVIEQIACQAPWCRGYNYPGTLVKTGTTVKELRTGEKLLYYTFCTACGCEYAMTKDGRLKERTYFIEFYHAVLRDLSNESIGQIVELPGFTKDKFKRCVAYFSTREDGIILGVAKFPIEKGLLKKFLNALESGATLKSIQQWSCWSSYQHFLIYRFQLDVMLAVNEPCRTSPYIRPNNGKNRVQQVLQQLLANDIDITVGSVCRTIGVCPETIRTWRCNTDIAAAKEEQRIKRIKKRKEEIYQQVNSYLREHSTDIVSSSDLYKYLGQQRTVIWRIDPKITLLIAEKLKYHNRNVLTHKKSQDNIGEVEQF